METRIRLAVQAMSGYVPGEQPSDPRVIKLNTNENPYPPSPRVVEALREVSGDMLRRYPDPMWRSVRERIAAMHGCDLEQVFVGNGSDEVLALCTRAFVEAAGVVGCFEPSYSLYPVLARIQDVQVRATRLGEDFTWRAPAGRHALFFLANPNAPTGMAFAYETVAGFCAAETGVVVIDEAYADFADGNAMALALERPNVLVSRTLSKSFSLAGLRVGYAVGDAALIGALVKIKDSYNVDALAQRLALAALEDVEWMRANVARIRATRERFSAYLRARGFGVLPSQTNFVMAQPPSVPAGALFERLRADGILVRYFAGPLTGRYLRITIGTDEQMDALMAWLDRELA